MSPVYVEKRWIEEDRGYETPCWIWQLAIRDNGYGAAHVPGEFRQMTAHRFMYVERFGPISDDLVVDHLCRVRSCVNPDHLEAVTQRENVMRGVGLCAVNARKTHCLRGHEFTELNTRIDPTTGKRRCRACARGERARRRVALGVAA